MGTKGSSKTELRVTCQMKLALKLLNLNEHFCPWSLCTAASSSQYFNCSRLQSYCSYLDKKQGILMETTRVNTQTTTKTLLAAYT